MKAMHCLPFSILFIHTKHTHAHMHTHAHTRLLQSLDQVSLAHGALGQMLNDIINTLTYTNMHALTCTHIHTRLY